MNSTLRRVLFASALAAVALVPVAVRASGAGPGAGAAPGSAGSAERTSPWTARTVELAASIPVQEGGRVKPLSTLAAFSLLRANGTRVYRTAAGEKLTPVHWILDAVFFPGDAGRERFFLVEEDAVLDAAGVEHEGRKRRDRYSFDELAPRIRDIFNLAMEYDKVDSKQRTPVQAQMLRLANNLHEFDTLAGFSLPATAHLPVGRHPALAAVFDGREEVGTAEFLRRLPALRAAAGAAPATAGGPSAKDVLQSLESFLHEIARSGGGGIALFPPPAAEDPDDPNRGAWMTPGELVARALKGGVDLEPQLDLLQGLEMLAVASAEPATFEKVMEEFHTRAQRQAEARGTWSKIPLEVTYYEWDFFYRALLCFVGAFLLVALTWLWPSSTLLRRLVPVPVALGLVLVTAGITLRCIIRGRPPVSTLYETIIFITGVSTAVALVAEWIHRRGVAIAGAAVFGSVGMFLSMKFETHEAVDTMPQLLAVLDTNFWLATHVTIINIGYAAGLFAGVVAHAWILGKLLGIRRGDDTYWKSVVRMVYGLLAFSLVFSLVGTILGGIWANDSWGRFWGWDPKENGALMICLWQLIILHARMGGYIRDRGLAMCAVFGGMVVAFSWWGVNLLGVGLHSYGFTSGAMLGLMIFYGIESVVLLAAGIHGLVGGDRRAAATASAA